MTDFPVYRNTTRPNVTRTYLQIKKERALADAVTKRCLPSTLILLHDKKLAIFMGNVVGDNAQASDAVIPKFTVIYEFFCQLLKNRNEVAVDQITPASKKAGLDRVLGQNALTLILKAMQEGTTLPVQEIDNTDAFIGAQPVITDLLATPKRGVSGDSDEGPPEGQDHRLLLPSHLNQDIFDTSWERSKAQAVVAEALMTNTDSPSQRRKNPLYLPHPKRKR